MTVLPPHKLVELLASKSGLSLLELAKRMHKASFQGTLHKFVHGSVESPSRATAKRIADYFKIPLDALYDARIAAQIAVEQGLIYSSTTVATPLQVNQPPPRWESPAPAPIQLRPTSLSPALMARIDRLAPHQLQQLMTMIELFLDSMQTSVQRKLRESP